MSALRLSAIGYRLSAVTFGCLVMAALSTAGPPPLEDPIPIRRVQIDARQFPAELQRQQEFLSVPRVEFEDRLQRARHAALAAQSPLMLQAAHFRAGWQDGHLIGSAALKFTNPNPAPGTLRLDPWNLAIRGQALLDRAPALLGDLNGKTLALIAARAGEQALALEWSARGDRRPEGWWFFLQTPAAPISMLELDLPENFVLECPGARQLVPIALPATDAKRRWQIAFGGAAPQELELLIRQPHQGESLLVLTRQLAEHELTLAAAESRFELDLDVPRGRVSEIILDADAQLEPTAAFLRQVVPQHLTMETRLEHSRKRIRLQLPEAMERRATIELHCRAPVGVAVGQTWTVPLLHVLGAHNGPATVQLRAPSEVVLSDWEFGDFRPAGPLTQEKRGTTTIETLTLVQTRMSGDLGDLGDLGPRPPRTRVQWHAADFAVRQEAWWHVGPESSALAVRSSFQVQSGRLRQLTLQLPVGWRLEDLELTPPALLASYAFDRRVAGQPLVVTLKEPVDAGTLVRLTTRLRPLDRRLNLQKKTALPVPQVSPQGARWLQQTLAISLERGQELRQPLFRAELQDAALVASLPPSMSQLWANHVQPPDFFATFHGRDTKSRLVIEPLEPDVQVEPSMEMALGATERRISYEVLLKPLRGAPSAVTLWLADAHADLHWLVASGSCRIREQRRVQGERGTEFELLFDRPMEGIVTLKGSAELPPGEAFAVPALHGLPASAARLVVRLQPGLSVDLIGSGLRPVAAQAAQAAQAEPGEWPIWRAFSLAPETSPLVCSVRPGSADGRPNVVVESEVLVLQVSPAGKLRSRYACLMNNPHGTTVDLLLPSGAGLHAVRADGHDLSVVPVGGRISLLAPAGRRLYEFEYGQDGPSWNIGSYPEAHAPTWEPQPVVLQTRRFWALPGGVSPVSQSGLVEFARPGSPSRWLGELPGLLDAETLACVFVNREPSWAEEQRALARATWQALPAEQRTGTVAQMLWRLEQRSHEPKLAVIVDQLARAGRGLLSQSGSWNGERVTLEGLLHPDQDGELTLMPCRKALLLTTHGRLTADGVNSAATAQLCYGEAIAAALAHGQNATGRFQTLQARTQDSLMQLLLPHGLGSGWTIWEEVDPKPGPQGAGFGILCIREESPWYAGLALGVLVCAAGAWLGQRAAPRPDAPRSAFLSALLLLSVLALIWLPPTLRPIAWCLLAALAGLVLQACQTPRVSRPRRVESTVFRRVAAVPPGLILVLMLFAASSAGGGAVATDAVTVYIVSSAASQPGQELGDTVLVPCTLWTRITESASRRAGIAGSSYAILEASYDGNVVNEQATVAATFQIHVFDVEPVDIVLPISNARLVHGRVNQAPALVTALPKEAGFRLRLAGRGRHAVQLTWISTVATHSALGSERELRCSIPPVSASRLNMQWSDGPRAAQAIGGRGSQQLRVEASEVHLEADLGRTPELAVRWWAGKGADAVVQVRSYHVWELNPQQPALRATIDYDVSHGAISAVRWHVPPMLDVKTVEVLPLAHPTPAPRLRDWRLEDPSTPGHPRCLVLEFSNPQSSPFRLQLEFRLRPALASPWTDLMNLEPLVGLMGQPGPWILAARPLKPGNLRTEFGRREPAEVEASSAFSRTLKLVLPTPIGVFRGDGFVGTRLDELRVDEVIPGRGLAALRPGEWPAHWPGLLAPRSGVDQAFRFSGADPGPLQLRVRPRVPVLSGRQSLSLTVSAAEVDVRAQLQLLVDEGSVTFLESQIPAGLTISSLQGSDVQRWMQQGARLQVWLKRSVFDHTAVSIRGWLRPVRQADGSSRVALPRLRLRDMPGMETRLEIRNQGVADLQLESLTGLRVFPGPFVEESVVGVWLAPVANYSGVLRFRPAPAARMEALPPTEHVKPATPVADGTLRILAAAYETALTGSGRAVTTVRYRVRHGAADDLRLRFSAQQETLSATINGLPATLVHPDEGTVLLSLPPSPGWSTVTVSWLQHDTVADQSVATLRLPQVEGVPAFPALLAVRAQPGASMLHPAFDSGARAAAAFDLRQAEEVLRWSQALAETRQPGGPRTLEALVLPDLQDFYSHLQAAEMRLEHAGADANARVLALRRDLERLASVTPWESIRFRAEESVRLGTADVTHQGPQLAGLGTVSYTQFQQNPDEVDLGLQPDERLQTQRLLFTSLVAALVLLSVLAARRSTATRQVLAKAWPEAALLTGVLWWLFLPGWPIGLAGVLVGLTVRLARLARVVAMAAIAGGPSAGARHAPATEAAP